MTQYEILSYYFYISSNLRMVVEGVTEKMRLSQSLKTIHMGA